MKQSALSAQSCQTTCDPMDCSPPGSSVHGLLQGKNTAVGSHSLVAIPKWVASPGDSSPGASLHFPHCKQTLHYLSHQGDSNH